MSEPMPCICGAKTENTLRHRAQFFMIFDSMRELSEAKFDLPKIDGPVILCILKGE